MSVENTSAGCFIVGSDTEVGKTFQASALARYLTTLGKRVGVYKPVASGVNETATSDAQLLHEAAKLDCPLARVCPQQFSMPLAPPVAARCEGRRVDEEIMIKGAQWWPARCDYLIVEGVGGVLSPVSDRMTFLDFMLESHLGFPSVIVAPNRVGVVNQALLTLKAIKDVGLPVAGILLNQLPGCSIDTDPSAESNLGLLKHFAGGTLVTKDLSHIWESLEVIQGDSARPNVPGTGGQETEVG